MGIFSKDGPDAASGASASTGSSDLAAAAKEIAATRRKSSRVEEQLNQAAQQADIEALYQSENWEEIAALYFNTRYAMTGFQGFLLTDEQKARLAVPLATMMRLLIRLDPRWIALIIFTANFGGTIAEKEIKCRIWREADQPQKVEAR